MIELGTAIFVVIPALAARNVTSGSHKNAAKFRTPNSPIEHSSLEFRTLLKHGKLGVPVCNICFDPQNLASEFFRDRFSGWVDICHHNGPSLGDEMSREFKANPGGSSSDNCSEFSHDNCCASKWLARGDGVCILFSPSLEGAGRSIYVVTWASPPHSDTNVSEVFPRHFINRTL